MGVSCYRINSPQVISETIENEVIIINLESGFYYNLNQTAADIWRLIETTANTDEIIASLSRQYEASPLEIKNAVISLIEQLQEEDIIVPCQPEPENKLQEYDFPHESKKILKQPAINKFTDMQELLLLDPIHEVEESGWPEKKPDLQLKNNKAK